MLRSLAAGGGSGEAWPVRASQLRSDSMLKYFSSVGSASQHSYESNICRNVSS